ncbi:MAG: zinc ABC transporter substrate-binding protein [Ilumatobacteraceae bacterium]
MSARDPENASAYQENFATFEAIVDEFDIAMRTAFDTVAERKLVTYHDAYAYFARTYDWEVIGAIQISDFEDPTPGEVAELIDQVRESGVPAIFGSEVFPSPVLAQIGREAGVEYVDVLRDDDLPGAPGDVEHSWLGLMRFNFVTMTEALGGDAPAPVRSRSATPHPTPPSTPVTTAADGSPSDTLVRLAGVTFRFGRDAVLDGIDLEIGPEQFTAIVGPSGSGKTTLLRVVLGTLEPSSGNVRRAPGLRLGYVPQVETVDWNFPVTVAQCVLMARTRGRVGPWAGRAERPRCGIGARAAGDRTPGRSPHPAALGRSAAAGLRRTRLLGEPDLLVMDEPTSGVDAPTRHDLLHLLGELSDDGTAIVLTTHDLNGMAAHLPHVVCLRTSIVASGAPIEVFTPTSSSGPSGPGCRCSNTQACRSSSITTRTDSTG